MKKTFLTLAMTGAAAVFLTACEDPRTPDTTGLGTPTPTPTPLQDMEAPPGEPRGTGVTPPAPAAPETAPGVAPGTGAGAPAGEATPPPPQ